MKVKYRYHQKDEISHSAGQKKFKHLTTAKLVVIHRAKEKSIIRRRDIKKMSQRERHNQHPPNLSKQV